MSSHQQQTPPDPADPIPGLLQRGLDFYGRNEVAEAVRCWRQVLAIDSSHPAALDYLESAGVDVARVPAQQAEIIDFGAARAQLSTGQTPPPPAPTTLTPAPAAPDGADIEPSLKRLLSERRYEEALDFLYAVRSRRPNDSALSRSIKLIREKLVVTYASRLGNLDHVPALTRPIAPADYSAEERQVLALVDGVSSHADIVAASPVGRLAALRLLCAELERGVLRILPATTLREPSVRVRATFDPLFSGTVDHSPVPASASSRNWRRPEPGVARPSNVPDSGPKVGAVTVKTPAPARPAADRGAAERPSGKKADAYDELFDRATQAYLARDYRGACDLFSTCCERRPDDTRAFYNLKALKRRLGEQ